MNPRRALTGAIAAVTLAVLCGCTGSAGSGQLTVGQLQGLVFAADLNLNPSFDLTFTQQPIEAREGVVESFWTESDGSPEECYPSYAASFLAGESSGDSDQFADIAGHYPEDGGAINVFGRIFDSEDAASGYLDDLGAKAEACSDVGGYQLSDGEDGVGWSVTGVTVEPADGLELPDGVTAVYQEELLAAGFAKRYRVTLLQYSNVVVAVMAQQLDASVFDFDQVDELAESVAERLVRL